MLNQQIIKNATMYIQDCIEEDGTVDKGDVMDYLFEIEGVEYDELEEYARELFKQSHNISQAREEPQMGFFLVFKSGG